MILSLATLILGCEHKPVIINPDLFKYDWVSDKDIYDNTHRLYFDDSLMFETLTNGIDPDVPYKISYDTLIIFSKEYDEYPSIKLKTFKYKIIRIDSLKLILKQVFPKQFLTFRDTVFFNRQFQTKKNDLRIDRIEFFSGGCFGECPVQSILIGPDSILYHYGYNSFSKHKGLSKYKLNTTEFLRIQNRLNSIERNSFKLCITPPDASHFELFIKSPNDSIETDGTFCSDNSVDFNNFIVYLEFLERFLNLQSIEGQEISFRYKPDH